jgi:flagellar basal-body rod protein FlgB
VSFEDALAQASAKGAEAVRDLPLEITEAEGAGAQPLRLDLELATQSETALRYGALVDLLGRELQLQRTIIRGGQ